VKLYFPDESVRVVVVPVPDLEIVTPETHGPVTVPEIVQFEVQLAITTDRVKFCVALVPTPLAAVI
jgi:hypothetical protein